MVIAREPLEHARDSDIKSLWNEVEEKLKEERQKDMVPIFLASWLIAHGNRQTVRTAYKELEKDAKAKFSDGNTYNKERFYSWMNKIQKGRIYLEKLYFLKLEIRII